MNSSCKPVLFLLVDSLVFLLVSGLSFPLLSSNDNNFKRGKAGGPRGVDRPKTNYGRMTCTVIYGAGFSLSYPYRPTVLFFHTYNAFVLANSTRATRADELDEQNGDEVYRVAIIVCLAFVIWNAAEVINFCSLFILICYFI